MRARLIDPAAPEWSALLASSAHDIYQLPAYAELAAWQEPGEAAAAYVDDGPGRRLLVPLVLRDLDGELRDAVSPYGYPGVLTDRPTDASFVAEAMEAVKAMLAEAHVVTMFLRLHPLLQVEGLEASGTILWHQTVAVDLSHTAEQIWADTRKNHRRDITKSMRDGTQVTFEATPERYSAFQSLYAAAMEHKGASHYYCFDRAYFDRLSEDLDQYVHLATVLIDGEIAAGGLFTECNGIVEVHLAAAEGFYAPRRPTKVLVHAICSWAKERENRWVHLGGGRDSAEDSLLHFKAGFSSHRARFGTLRTVLMDGPYRARVAAHDAAADPSDLTGYFPRYRRRKEVALDRRW